MDWLQIACNHFNLINFLLENVGVLGINEVKLKTSQWL